MTTTTGAPWNLRKPESTDALASIDDQVRNLADDVDAALDSVVAAPAWTALPLTNGWANNGGGHATAAYRKVGDCVELRGLIVPGSLVAAAFTLPAGYRPASGIHWFIGHTNAVQPARIEIAATGVCIISSATTWASLAQVRFSVT